MCCITELEEMFILHTPKKARHVDQSMRRVALNFFTYTNIEANITCRVTRLRLAMLP